MKTLFRTLIVLMAVFHASVFAHTTSQAYLQWDIKGATAVGNMEFSLIDLEHSVGIDADGDGAISWKDVNARRSDILAYINAGVTVKQDSRGCALSMGDLMMSDTHGSLMLYVPVTANCPSDITHLDLNYSLFFNEDIRHHAIHTVANNGMTISRVSTHDNRNIELDFSGQSMMDGFIEFLKQGVWHIWIGLDHILFVVLLILSVENFLGSIPAEKRRSQRWRQVLKTVTGFSIAHSITLTAATLNWVSLPSTWVESIIALSVILAALNVIFKWFNEKLWLFAFGFGLLHGFGFASVLNDLGLTQSDLVISLLAFNLGVEFGQIVIVLLALPVILFLSNMRTVGVYAQRVVASGVFMLASVWFFERIAL